MLHRVLASTFALAVLAAVAAPPASAQTFEDQVMELVNQARWDNGQLPPLKRCGLLDTSAEGHSQAMADRDFFAHCDLDTHTLPWDRMTAAGYFWNAAAENIAMGQTTPAGVMSSWMDSPGHRANLLSTTTREIGIGYVYQGSDQPGIRKDADGNCVEDGTYPNGYRHYWTQNFGRRSGVYPVVIDREAATAPSRDVDLYLYGSGWAAEMRIRNAEEAWGDWQPFAADVAWTLSPGNGTRTVEVEIRNGATVYGASDTIELDAPLTAVPDAGPGAGPASLRPAAPNPFYASTRLSYALTEAGPVRLAVYDLAGREVARLVVALQPAGEHAVSWNGRDDAGARRAPGIYFVRLVAGGTVRTVKVVLAR